MISTQQRKSGAERRVGVCLLCAVLFCASAGLAMASGSARAKAAPPQDLPDHVNELVRQLYGVELYDSGDITKQVQDLVIGSLTSWMSSNGFEKTDTSYPLDVRVRMQLDHAFSKLHYPFFGTPRVFVRPWNGGELIAAGYTLGWSDFERVNVLVLYFEHKGETRQVALAHFVPRTDMHYAFLPPSASGAFRFLVYGNRSGKSQPRLSAILYSFDGKTLSNLWERQDLYDGKLTVAPDEVTVRYLIESEYIQATQQGQLPPWHRAVYKVTGKGLTLLSERLVPYQSGQ